MKRALCLQGGGAKGAFQAGALKALTERGYKFDCAVGASVGCLNAAMVALGKVDLLYDVWKELDFADVLPLERKAEGERLSFRSIAGAAIGAILSGVDTARIRTILEKYIDEEALRRSKVRFGLVTVRSEGKDRRLCKLFLEDIPQGKVIDYMMASAALPFFKKVEIDGVRYLDGGMMDNLPIEMLAEAGYRNVVAIRLGGDIRYESGKDMKIDYIDPSESAGHTINFSNVAITRSLHLGYFDVLRKLDGLVGEKYYIKPFSARELRRFLRGRRDALSAILSTRAIGIGAGFRDEVAIVTYLISESLGKKGSFEEVWIAFAEFLANVAGLTRWRVYSIRELLEEGLRRADYAKEFKDDEGKAKALSLAHKLSEEERK